VLARKKIEAIENNEGQLHSQLRQHLASFFYFSEQQQHLKMISATTSSRIPLAFLLFYTTLLEK
jgi:hypothetical protein